MKDDAANPGGRRLVGEEFKTLQPQESPLQFPSESPKRPTVIVVIGMAGTGKTSAVRALRYHFNQSRLLYDCAKKSTRSIHEDAHSPIGVNRPPSHSIGRDPSVVDPTSDFDKEIRDVRNMDPIEEAELVSSSNVNCEVPGPKSQSNNVTTTGESLDTEGDYAQLITGAAVAEAPGGQAVSAESDCHLSVNPVQGESSSGPTDEGISMQAVALEVTVPDCESISAGNKLGGAGGPATSDGKMESVTSLAPSSTETTDPSASCIVKSKSKCYIINLDPAVSKLPYPANIDIRDTIKYKEVMKEYQLGPNGAVITSLNLFATRFDQVLELLEKRASTLDYVIIDTPGQIEVFNWSASGSIILDSLAVTFPTIVLYVIDTPRCRSPITFMSNMMYACSVLYKSRLPFIMAFNKIDVQTPIHCFEWMRQYDTYAEAVQLEDSYMATLSRSCALAMNEFYEGIRSVGISATGHQGLEQLESHLEASRQEYFEDYLPWLTAQRAAVRERRMAFIEGEASKLRKISAQQSTHLLKKVDDGGDEEDNEPDEQ